MKVLKIIGTVAGLCLILTVVTFAATIRHKRPAGMRFNLEQTLQQGSEGPEVKLLQQVLNSHESTIVSKTGAGSPGNESEFFGAKTKTAVINFGRYYQTNLSQSIYRNPGLTNDPGAIAVGIVDERAQRFINSLPEIKIENTPAPTPAPAPAPTPVAPARPAPTDDSESTGAKNTAKELAKSFGGFISGVTVCNCSAGMRITVVGPFGGNFLVIPDKTNYFGGKALAGPVLGKYEKGGSCSFGVSGCRSNDTIDVLDVKGTVESISLMFQ